MEESEITFTARTGEAITFGGEKAVQLFQLAVLNSGLGLLEKGIKPGRGWTLRAALERTSYYTKKTYGRGKKSIPLAREDLRRLIAEAKAQIKTREI